MSADNAASDDRERADHIDALCDELAEQDFVPPDVLAPIRAYAVWLRSPRTLDPVDDPTPRSDFGI